MISVGLSSGAVPMLKYSILVNNTTRMGRLELTAAVQKIAAGVIAAISVVGYVFGRSKVKAAEGTATAEKKKSNIF